MSENEIHVGDVGTRFLMVIQDENKIVDISTATTKTIYLGKPDGSKLTKTAQFVNNGADGQIYYTSIAGDLDVAGSWSIQGAVAMPSGTWHSDITKFMVYANL